MTHHFDPAILREYDVRGTVGRNLDTADAYAVGRGFATRVRRARGARIVVGRDGRLSSPDLEAALVDGLTAGGVDVVRIGVGPTPMLYFAEATLGVDGGVQVTGSHNPPGDNGFKLMLRHRSFWGDDVTDLARLAAAGDWITGNGTVGEADVMDAYVARLRAGHTAGAYRIGWDCGNGAAGPVVPRLVRARGLDFGVAFDGDGDRIGAVDGEGRVLWGDQLLCLLMEPVLAACPGAAVVADVKSSRHVFDRIVELGGRPVMGATGHSPMKEAMIAHDAPIAGELSGHIFFRHDWYGFDDAILAVVRLIDAVDRSGRSLTQLRDAMPALVNTPDVRVPVPAADKWRIVAAVRDRLAAAGADVSAIDGVRVTTPDGWWLLRASNTQDMLTLRAEGSDDAALARLLREVDAHLAACGGVRD